MNRYAIIIFIIFILLNSNMLLFGQQIFGTVIDFKDGKPVEFVSIVITGKNIAAVSDKDGKFSLKISPDFHNDSIKFLRVGYHTYDVKVSEFIERDNYNVSLKKNVNDLEEVVVQIKKAKKKNVIQNFWGWLTSCRNKESEQSNNCNNK